MAITIRVPWEAKKTVNQEWNELLAWTVETYGLPGEKVSFHPTHDWMDFTFNDEHDAIMFQLKTGGHRREPEEYAVDLVGEFINR